MGKGGKKGVWKNSGPHVLVFPSSLGIGGGVLAWWNHLEGCGEACGHAPGTCFKPGEAPQVAVPTGI